MGTIFMINKTKKHPKLMLNTERGLKRYFSKIENNESAPH